MDSEVASINKTMDEATAHSLYMKDEHDDFRKTRRLRAQLRNHSYVAPSATSMINRINDLRGLLIQLLKVKELPLNLPKTAKGLLSIYDPKFNPGNDLPREKNAVSILPPISENPQVVKLYKAVKAGTPLHILCPKALLVVGNQTEWSAEAARYALRPILQTVQ